MTLKFCGDCNKPAGANARRGRCNPCYKRHIAELKREGTYAPRPAGRPRIPAVERALARISPDRGGCWVYTGTLDRDGYGQIGIGNKTAFAHRVVYEALKGPIPAGLQLDHLCHTNDGQCLGGVACRHRRCVNPDHLAPVTSTENTHRGNGPSAINRRKTHCPRGHEYSVENTRVVITDNPRRPRSRYCIACG